MNDSKQSPRAPAGPGSVKHLSTAECWELVEARSFGRLAVAALDGMPDVFPLNYTVHDGSIYIRTARGSKLKAISVHPVAAFEIDGEDDGFYWSVVLRGSARRVAMDSELHESGVLTLISASPTSKHDFICVTPVSITGRRFAVEKQGASVPRNPPIWRKPVSAQEPTRPYEDTTTFPDVGHPASQRPTPISHFPPR